VDPDNAYGYAVLCHLPIGQLCRHHQSRYIRTLSPESELIETSSTYHISCFDSILFLVSMADGRTGNFYEQDGHSKAPPSYEEPVPTAHLAEGIAIRGNTLQNMVTVSLRVVFY
jgi:hypothetical protein